MEFLRQGPQGLAQQRHCLHMDRDFLRPGLEHIAADADDVPDVVLAEVQKFRLTDGVGTDVKLDLALAVLNVAEDGLAHAPLGHDAAADGNSLSVKGVIVLFDLPAPGAADKPGLLEGVSSLLLQGGKLVPADLQYF